jgi:hypothetical protein
VVLRGGLSIPLAAVLLALDLEARGFRVTADGDGLIVRPGSRLTADDRARIQRHRDALIALTTHCDEGVQ